MSSRMKCLIDQYVRKWRQEKLMAHRGNLYISRALRKFKAKEHIFTAHREGNED